MGKKKLHNNLFIEHERDREKRAGALSFDIAASFLIVYTSRNGLRVDKMTVETKGNDPQGILLWLIAVPMDCFFLHRGYGK